MAISSVYDMDSDAVHTDNLAGFFRNAHWSRTRLTSCALTATMTVLTDIDTRAIAGRENNAAPRDVRPG